MKIQLDFDTPNGVQRVPLIDRRRTPRPPNTARPVCPFSFQPGLHPSAAECLQALERAVSP